MSIDHVEAVGPTGVCLLCRIAKFVEHGWDLDAEFSDARSGDHGALLFVSRSGENNFVFDVAFHLPDVAGMRLQDIDHKERHPATVLVIKFVEGRNLPPERRSGVTAKDQHDRTALRGETGQLHGSFLVERR